MYGFNSNKSKAEVPKIYTSPTAPQEGSTGDLWLKTERILAPEAYAVYDSNDESLTIFRDEIGKYTDGQVVGTKTYYAGIEDITGNTNPKWRDKISSVTKVIIKDIFRPKTAFNMFDAMTNLTKIEGIENLDTSECTNMRSMFEWCQNLTKLDVSSFDTSECTNMGRMFWGCKNLENLDVSRFDTSNVDNMGGMFYDCQKLAELDLSHFDTSNVTNMYNMFSECYNLETLDISHFDTSKIVSIHYMFQYCYKLTATLHIMKMPSEYYAMCQDTSRDSGKLTLKYTSPVTSANIDTLVATKGSGNVVNGGPA